MGVWTLFEGRETLQSNLRRRLHGLRVVQHGNRLPREGSSHVEILERRVDVALRDTVQLWPWQHQVNTWTGWS